MKDKNSVKRINENVTQLAVNQTEFGWFNWKIFLVTSLISLNIGFGLGSVGLVLPSAACDFKMSTISKGRMAMMPVAGMIFGPYFWGNLVDMKGRKVGLISSLCIQGVADILSSVISNYYGFLVLKFFSGFGLSGQLSLMFTYIGEFQPCKYRDGVLSWLEMPWAVGLMIVAGLGWIIIPLDFQYYSSTFFFFNSWNIYVLVSALLAPLIAFWIYFLPETPKYLAETGQRGKLLQILSQMYRENTGKTHEDFLERIKNLNNIVLDELIHSQESISIKKKSFSKMFKNCLGQTKELMRPPHLKTTVLMCVAAYSITSSYFTMVFWLPEIFQRFAIFEEQFPERSASICTVSAILYSRNATKVVENDFSNCGNKLNPTVFSHNLIVGAACVPVALWLPLCVDRFGYKLHLIGASFLASILAFGLFFVENSTQNLILSCAFEALASISITIVMCMLVELYPTNIRVVASAFATFIGRIGAFIGISLVGYLIDNYCNLLVALVGTHLAIAGIVGFFVPHYKTKETFLKQEKLSKKQAEDSTEP